MGFTGLALAAMLHRDGFAQAGTEHQRPDGRPHFAPKAKSVIWIFCCGGTSHVESFDPKPELNRYAGKNYYSEDPLLRRALSNPERFADVRPVFDGMRVPAVSPTEKVMGIDQRPPKMGPERGFRDCRLLGKHRHSVRTIWPSVRSLCDDRQRSRRPGGIRAGPAFSRRAVSDARLLG